MTEYHDLATGSLRPLSVKMQRPSVSENVIHRCSPEMTISGTSTKRHAMKWMHAFLSDHRKLASLLVAQMLVMKVLVPTAFMIGTQGMVLTVQICADASGEHLSKQILIPMENKSSPDQGKQGKADETCPFSGLSMASLASVDVTLLLIAIAFIMVLGFTPVQSPRPRSADYLRPPLRGPPTLV